MKQIHNPESGHHLVLHIEDNEMNVELAYSIFEEMPGLELIIAADAKTGVSLARSRLPDLILMDINLPGMDGISAAKLIKETSETKDIPIIALSAEAMSDDIDRAMEVGFEEYITKPFKVSSFMDLINSILSGNRLKT